MPNMTENPTHEMLLAEHETQKTEQIHSIFNFGVMT